MSHKLLYKTNAICAHCGYRNHKQNLVSHRRETVLEEHPVFMAWLFLSATYRILFGDLMDGVGGEDSIKIDLQEVEWGGLGWVDMAEDRDR